MKKNIFFYLFCFTSLIAIFTYVNSKSVFNILTDDNAHYKEKNELLRDSISFLTKELISEEKYSLGESGKKFYQEIGIENPQKWITQQLMDMNPEKGNHPLIQYYSQENGFHFYDVKILNHRWIIGKFTDGEFNGEALLEYDITKDHKITFKELSEIIFPKSY